MGPFLLLLRFSSYIKKFSYTELYWERSVHEEMWVLQMAPLSVALLAKRVAFLDSPKIKDHLMNNSV